MTNQEKNMKEWERKHHANIIKWEADWTIKAGYKIVTFYLTDNSKKVFELAAPTGLLYGG